MKDLYWRNGLRPREEDRVKLHDANGNEEDREAAFSILLNASKKAEYDRTHLALSRVGYLRRHLGLAGRNNWRAAYEDFLEPTRDEASVPPPVHKQATNWLPRLVGWFLLTAVFLALLLPLIYLLLSALRDVPLFAN